MLVHGFALGEADALTLLRQFNQRCVPTWSESALVHKIKSAANSSHLLPRGHLLGDGKNGWPVSTKPIVAPPKPRFKRDVLKRISKKVSGIKDVVLFLAGRSPVKVERQDSASVLHHLYAHGSGEKIILFNDMDTQGQLVWDADKSDPIQNKHLPRGKNGVWFLPQPVDGEYHPNPRLEEKSSRRSQESVTA